MIEGTAIRLRVSGLVSDGFAAEVGRSLQTRSVRAHHQLGKNTMQQ